MTAARKAIRTCRGLRGMLATLEVRTEIAHLFLPVEIERVALRLDPEAGHGAIELVARALPPVPTGVPSGAVTYRFADPLVAPFPLPQRAAIVRELVAERRPVPVREILREECPACGRPPGGQFCAHCGVRVRHAVPVVCNGHHETPASPALLPPTNYCPDCGANLGVQARAQLRRFQLLG